MAEFASKDHPKAEVYKLMIGCIVPRPIGWVATVSRDGIGNLAPFSFFNGVGHNPPAVAFSVIDRNGELKDTSRNVGEVPEFVVHIVSEDLAAQMNETCADFGAHVDEFKEAGLTPVPGTLVKASRIKEAKIAMECRVMHHLRVGPSTSHIIGEVLYWHIDDSVLMERGRIDANKLQAIGRMGGLEYTRTLDRFAIPRPVIADEDPRSIASYQRAQAIAAKLP